jgi:2,4-dienoyl-CoA reductase (NADPH2)
VILVSRSQESQLARSAEMIYREVLLKRLAANSRIQIICAAHLIRVTESSATLRKEDGAIVEFSVSRVLVAQGRKPDSLLAIQLRGAGVPFVTIGDARQGGRIGDAVRDAYEAVMSRNRKQRPAESAGGQLQC